MERTVLVPRSAPSRSGAFLDAVRVIVALPGVETGRRFEGPASLVRRLRSRSVNERARSDGERARLKRIIRWVDARLPGGGNCYRRSLLEMALDRGAAQEPLHLGLSSTGMPGSGHAWLGAESDGRRYDVVISL